MLLPPDLRDWVPAEHLVHFVIDAVEQLDLRAARVNERGSGSEQYPPAMMLALLIYSYATGLFGSRRIEQSTFDHVPVRLLCADTHPDHDTICAFRRGNHELVAHGFAQVLELAARCGVLKVGDVTVALDGTKVLANASKHAAVSYGRAGERLQQVDLEIEQLLRRAEAEDNRPWQDGLNVQDELSRRHARRARLAQARADMEARAYAEAQAKPTTRREDPPAPPPEAPWLERLAHRTATRAGRARYKLRQQTIEPVFGIIKAGLGFRRFQLRGLAGVASEWTLVTLAYNRKRLFHLHAVLSPA